jgi:hypothetical protein
MSSDCLLYVRRCALFMALVFLFVVLCGCQARETNQALQMSDQAQEAAQRKISTDLSATVVHLPEAMRQQQRQLIEEILLLLAASRDSIRPALALSQGNEPAPETRTTAELAYQQPKEFARQSAIQTGRAHAEVEGYLSYVRAAAFIAQYGQQLATDWLSLLLLGTGGVGLAGGALAKGIQAFNSVKRAAKDAVEFGNDALAATKPDEIKKVLDKHKIIQESNGTRNTIKKLGAHASVTTEPL